MAAVIAHSSIQTKCSRCYQPIANSHNTVREKSIFNQATKTVQNSTDLRKDDNFCFQIIYRIILREASKSLVIFTSGIESHKASCFGNSAILVDSN